MSTLLLVFLGVMMLAAVATLIALGRAEDGYEDETGYHPDPAASRRIQEAPLPRDGEAERAPVGAPIPSGLVEAR